MDRRKIKKTKKKKPKRSGDTTYECDICSKHFSDKYAVIKHKAIHSDETPYQCQLCEYAGKTRQYLRKHVRVKHGERKFECEVCQKTFHYDCKLRDHMRVHTGEKPYKCGDCDKAFSSSYSFNTHKLIHTNSKPFECSFCPYACRDNSTLRKHEARHTGQVIHYTCNVCNVSCKTKALLKFHIAEKHFDVDMRRLECDACGKRFKFKNALVVHIQNVHEKSRRCKCEVCGVVISSRLNIRAHMRTHVDEKPFMCTFEGCGKRYKSSGDLKKHVIKHYPERHYPCKICERRFPKEKNMLKHLKTHMAKVKEVECDYCHVRFYNTKYLTNHIRRKHGRKKKKYICDICDFETTNKPSIVMHIKYGHATNENPLICAICEKPFKREFNLKLHYWTAHEVEYGIPVTTKKKCKETNKTEVVVKEEPVENVYNGEEIFHVSPKIEPLDEEGLEELTNIVPPSETTNELEDIPEGMMEELITPVVREPENKRLKYTQLDFVDKKSEERARKKIDGLMETRRQKIEERRQKRKQILEKRRQKSANRELERTRRKYNMLMRKAVERIKEGQVKIKQVKNVELHPNALLVENFSINQTIDSTECIIDEITSDDIEKGKDENEGEVKNKEGNTKDSNEENRVNIEGGEDALEDNEIENTEKHKNDDEVGINDIEDSAAKENENKTEMKLGQNRKLKFNTHQCYVCFKLFQTKEMLLDHCRDHFDLCSMKTLKKCPICNFTTDLSITTHLKRKHDIKIKVPYGTFKNNANSKGTGYYYEVNDDRIKTVEIIPSIKNLNKRESCKIDKKNRENKNKGVVKSKLVKKGKEWIVLKEKIKIDPQDCLLPKLGKLESKDLKGGYCDRLKELYKVARKEGKKMLFPCDSCDKVCQTLAALKLHGRKHEVNPKPFKPKVWKHKIKGKNGKRNDPETNRPVVNKVINKENRTAQPKPVVNKHKCDKELIEFYEQNIKGSDIEFWQFLKIYNKMGRDGIKDFDDPEMMMMQKSDQFRLQCNEPEENTSSNDARNNDSVHNRKVPVKKVRIESKSARNAFKRVVRLSKKELMRRNEVKRRLRENLQCNSLTSK